MDFVAIKDFWTPVVYATGQPHRPTAIRKKRFKKGEIITGEIKTANGKPSFVLHKGTMMIPLSCVKQVVVKDIVLSNADGNVAKDNPKVEVKVIKSGDQRNKDYFGGILIGGALGFGAVILAEKQGWIPEGEKKNKLYGLIVGAIVGTYYVYKYKK